MSRFPKQEWGQAPSGSVEPVIEENHWKVGDGMKASYGSPKFVIAQMAFVTIDEKSNQYEVRYFDSGGVLRYTTPVNLDFGEIRKRMSGGGK